MPTPGVSPGASDACYDGLDADCRGNDDDDCDGDGAASDDADGLDCDDADATISPDAREGWGDAGIDNDCDGDPHNTASAEADEFPRLDGAAGAGFGGVLSVMPAGWLDAEEVLLVGARALDQYRGAAYGWRASSLGAGDTSSADWSWVGADFSGPYGASMGSALGWAGDAARPVLLIGEVASGGSLGSVYGWVGGDVGLTTDGATFVLTGDAEGQYVGGSLASGADLDGDGTSDLIVEASLDSQFSASSGTVGVLFDPASYTGTIGYGDVDVVIGTVRAGASLTPVPVGDADGDGTADLGLSTDGQDGPLPSGAVIAPVPAVGAFDYEAIAPIVVYASGLSVATDLDRDGSRELLATSGGVFAFPLPASGALYPWEDAYEVAAFDDAAVQWLSSVGVGLPDYDGALFFAACYSCAGSRGRIALDSVHDAGASLEEARYLLSGASAGDELGASFALIDVTGDAIDDLAIGAPLVDEGGTDAGAVYLVPGP